MPVAAHLSGGLDSSAIAVLAARKLRREHRTLLGFSFVDPVRQGLPPRDERPYVESVLRQEPSIDWTPVTSNGALDRSALQQDRVLSASPDCAENMVCAQAAQRGARLILSGWGGDEGATFNGRGVLAGALLTLRTRYFLHELNSLRRRRGFSPAGILRGEILSYLLPNPRQPSLLQPGLARQARRLRPRRMGVSARRNQLALLTSPHLSHRMVDWAETGAAHGLSFAFPLLDRRVLDCALSIPASFYLRDGWKRRPFRDAMHGVLPEQIRWRHDKLAPFSESFFRLAMQRDALRTRLRALLANPAVSAVFDPEKAQLTLERMPTPFELIRDPSRQQHLLHAMTLLNYGRFLVREQSPTSSRLIPVVVAEHARRPSNA